MSIPHPKGGAIVWTCVKDNIVDEKEDYKDIGLRGFDYTLFEEEEGGGTREGLGGYTYLKHIIQLWPGDWPNKMVKMNEAVGMSSGNALVAFYRQLPMGRKDTIFGVIYQNIMVR